MKYKVIVYQISEPRNQISYELDGKDHEDLPAAVAYLATLLQPDTALKHVQIVGKIAAK